MMFASEAVWERFSTLYAAGESIFSADPAKIYPPG